MRHLGSAKVMYVYRGVLNSGVLIEELHVLYIYTCHAGQEVPYSLLWSLVDSWQNQGSGGKATISFNAHITCYTTMYCIRMQLERGKMREGGREGRRERESERVRE